MTDKEKLEVQVTTQGADRAARELDQVSKKADELDNKKISLGGLTESLGGLVGPGGLVAGLGAGMAFVANSTADAAIEADNLAALTGDSVETASRLNAVWKQTGADTKDLQDVLLQMNGVLSTNAAIAEQLGVNLEDGATVGQRFEQVSDALDRITDAAKRSQIASQVFGEEGVRQYNALRQAVGDVGGAMEEVADGQVFDEGDVEQARKMKQELTELKGELIGVANAAGKVAIPAINGLIDAVKQAGEDIFDSGHALRNFITTGDITTEADRIVQAWEDSSQAARDFDRTLLDGLTTFEQVRSAVLEHTDNVTAANIVALEWKRTQEELPPVIDAVTEALNASDQAWQKYLDAQQRGQAIAEGAPGTFAEMQDAVGDLGKAARDSADDWNVFEDGLRKSADIVDTLTTKLNEARDRLDLETQLDDITDQFEKIRVAGEEANEEGEAGTRRYREEVRRLRLMLLDLLEDLDHLSGQDKIRLTTEIERGSLDQLFGILGELTRGVTVPVSFSSQPQQAFSGVNFTVAPNAIPSTNLLGLNPAPVDNRQTTIIYPVGTTPTGVTVDKRLYDIRNDLRTGIR